VQDYMSYLKIKNISLADDVSDGDLTTNVASQPLVGRSYATEKWGNGFELFRRVELAAATSVNNYIVAGYAYGEISQNESDFDLGGVLLNFNTYAKPLPPYMLGTSTSAKQRINPGELKVSVCKWKASMKFNVFIAKYLGVANESQTASKPFRPIGAAKVFAFEREVEIGTRSNTSIKLAYGVNNFIKVRGYTVASKMPPYTDTAN